LFYTIDVEGNNVYVYANVYSFSKYSVALAVERMLVRQYIAAETTIPLYLHHRPATYGQRKQRQRPHLMLIKISCGQ
jgi:hypothetical protein